MSLLPQPQELKRQYQAAQQSKPCLKMPWEFLPLEKVLGVPLASGRCCLWAQLVGCLS